MNSIALMGRITKDIELKTYGDDGKMIRFAIAVNRGKDKNGNDMGADFPNIVAFGKRAEVISKYFHKGNNIAVTGHLHTDSYEKDGKKVYTTDVYLDGFDFVDRSKEEPKEEKQETINGFSISAEDIPF